MFCFAAHSSQRNRTIKNFKCFYFKCFCCARFRSAEGKKNDEYGRNVTTEYGSVGTSQKKESEKGDVRYVDSSCADRYVVAFCLSFDLDGFGVVAIGRGNAAGKRLLGYACAERVAVEQLSRSVQSDPVYALFQKQRDRHVAHGARHGGFRVFGVVCVFKTALARAERRVYGDARHDDIARFYPDDSHL